MEPFSSGFKQGHSLNGGHYNEMESRKYTKELSSTLGEMPLGCLHYKV